MTLLDLEKRVHNCLKCKKTSLREMLPYPPVYSFGDPNGKEIMVVGLNPSAKEYVNGYLSSSPSIEVRRNSQLTYFENRKYRYFEDIERFFGDEVKRKINWSSSPWEKVGCLDLVKCPTISIRGQWSKISRKQQNELISNCEGYLKEQLNLYKPKIILTYGADVGRWFANHLNLEYGEFEDRKAQLNNREVYVMFAPQRQGPHSKPEVLWVKDKILAMLNAIMG
jgi:hypothetical protein